MADFHFKNGWITNRGDGLPSVNMVILSFVHPLRLLNKTTDGGTLNGVPVGMDADHARPMRRRWRRTAKAPSSGMQGFLFWAAECPSTRNACTTPPSTCEGGMGLGAKQLNIPISMPALRQQ